MILFPIIGYGTIDSTGFNKQEHQRLLMGWWPFKSKPSGPRSNDPIRKDTRTWLEELQETCEKNFDKPEEARRIIRQLQVEWKDAVEDNILDNTAAEGLQARAFRLLTCDDEVWMEMLDDLDFWKLGWRPFAEEESEN